MSYELKFITYVVKLSCVYYHSNRYQYLFNMTIIDMIMTTIDLNIY